MESGSQIAAIPIGAAESAVKLPAAPALQAKQELTWFSPYAEWSANGISDLLKRVSLEGQAVRVQAVEPKPAGGCTEPVVAYAARGGKVLLHSPARQKPGTCVEWFDPLSSRRTMALAAGAAGVASRGDCAGRSTGTALVRRHAVEAGVEQRETVGESDLETGNGEELRRGVCG